MAIPLVLAIVYFYAYLASAGTFRTMPQLADYYDRMAEGFRAGHLYIVEAPKPQLLAKSDPYANENFYKNLWLWDASLYNKRYYMYWGPVPGLLLLAWKVLTGCRSIINDQWPTVIYMSGRLVFGTGLILGLAKYVRTVPTWLVALVIAVFGLSAPIPFIAARPDVYEASLAAGQCFTFAGLWACFLGITHESRRSVWFVVASTMWGLAFGSRATTIIAVPSVMLATLYYVRLKLNCPWARVFVNAMCLGLPMLLFTIAYGVYNYARFDSLFQFGTRYQVTLQPFSFHTKYLVANIYSYLFAPLKWSCAFPFVEGQTYRPLSKLILWPSGYMTFEKVAGLLNMSGFLWLLPLPLAWVIEHFVRRAACRSRRRHASIPYLHLWAIACSVGLVLTFVPALGLWEASMRYAGDAIGGLVIIAAIAAFSLVRHSEAFRTPSRRRLCRLLVLTLGLHSCFIGAFSAFASYGEPFKKFNPELYAHLSKALSLCH